LIFKYATKYYFEHGQIDPPSEFLLTTKDYDLFTNWLAGQDFSYQTNAEKSLEEIKNTARKEETWIQIKDEYAKLQSEIERKKTVELTTYKKQISRLLEKEIVSRYYFESGAVESGFVEDIFVIKAIEILNSSEKYLGLLN
jgi:carboxyl-terminal processing protease